MPRLRKLLLVHLPTVAWAAWMAYLLTSPAERLPLEYPEFSSERATLMANLFEWALHALLSLVLCALLGRSLATLERRPHLVATAFSVAIYGAVLEGLQTFAPGRAPGVSDLVANLLGVAAWLAVASRRRTGAPP